MIPPPLAGATLLRLAVALRVPLFRHAVQQLVVKAHAGRPVLAAAPPAVADAVLAAVGRQTVGGLLGLSRRGSNKRRAGRQGLARRLHGSCAWPREGRGGSASATDGNRRCAAWIHALRNAFWCACRCLHGPACGCVRARMSSRPRVRAHVAGELVMARTHAQVTEHAHIRLGLVEGRGCHRAECLCTRTLPISSCRGHPCDPAP